MTELEASAARLLCVGFAGDDAASADVAALTALGPGALLLFARNVTTPERTRALARAVAGAIEARTGRRPWVGVDQEGGRVARLNAGATAMPSAMAIGAAGDPSLAEAAGRAIARDLRAFGCDVDFAPVLDLALDPASRVVGTRAFGDDASSVGLFGAAFARGLAAGGVAPVPKHAPGHGATAVDSHDDVPVLGAGAALLAARDLAPFREVRAAGVSATMLAHVVVPALGDAPASLDPRAIALVRESVGDELLLMTDCLQMGAIARTIGTAEAAAAAIAAGADLAIVSHDLALAAAAARAIARDVRSGRIAPSRFAAALAAGDRFRARVRELGASAMSLAGETSSGAESGPEVARAIARRSLTLLRGASLPDLAPGDAVTIVSFEGPPGGSAEAQGLGGRADGGRPSLAAALRGRRVRADHLRAPLAPSAAEIEALTLVLAGQGARPLVVIARGARFAAAQAAAIVALAGERPRAIVVCASEPFDLVAMPAARTVLCTYGDGPAEMDALAEALTGALVPAGRSPLVLAAASRP